MLIHLLISQALALGVGLSVGGDAVVEDPLLDEVGIRGGVDLAPRPYLAFGVSFAGYPDLGERGLTELGRQLVEEDRLFSGASPIRWRAQATAALIPFWASHGDLHVNVGMYAGFGATRTVDDLEALGRSEDPASLATERQTHPTLGFGLTGEIGGDVVRLRLRYDHVVYIETLASTVLELRDVKILGAEMVIWL